jgi:hypothetical protein
MESIGDKIAQVYSPIQKHMNNASSEMISCSLALLALITFLLFIDSHKHYGITFIPLRTSMVVLF